MARALSDTGWHRRYINIPPRKKIGKNEEKKDTHKKREMHTQTHAHLKKSERINGQLKTRTHSHQPF